MSENKNTYRQNNNDLDQSYRKNPFDVPEGYFNRLHADIMTRVGEAGQDRKADSVVPLFRSKRLVIPAVAATIALIIAILFFNSRENAVETAIPVVSLEQLLEEHPEYIEEMDEWLLIETILAENSVDYFDGSDDDSPSIDSSISNENILKYLYDENFDPENI